MYTSDPPVVFSKIGQGWGRRKKMAENGPLDGGRELAVRQIQASDKSKGFMELLQQLTVCGSVSDREFEERVKEINARGDDHIVCVIEDDHCGKVVATGSLFIERKFVRNCGKVGHIEDVVVDSNSRRMQLGHKVVKFLADHALAKGCYKVILDSNVDNQAFYEKCGFAPKGIHMAKYFT